MHFGSTNFAVFRFFFAKSLNKTQSISGIFFWHLQTLEGAAKRC